jgi:RNA polymerase sigma-70 factor (ECF subfamily)
LLRDVFDYGYGEIAEILDRTEPSVRQLAVRARRHVREGRPRFAVSQGQRERLASRFFAAVERGDLPALEAMLAEDVVLRGDGGGKAPALATPVSGRDRIARTIIAWAALGHRIGGSLRPLSVNGGPGALVLDAEDRVVAVWALEMDEDQVTGIASIVNPDKLRHLGEVGNLTDTLRAAVHDRR